MKSMKAAEPGARAGERAELRISKTCRRNCVFCCEARGMRSGAGFMPLAEAGAIMKSLRRGGTRHLTLIGGEPTIHPDFHRVTRIAKLLGFTVQVTTDGTGLAEPARAAEVLADVDELCLSVHWHAPALARAITRLPSAFAATEAAFANIARYGRLKLFMCHTVLCSRNIGGAAAVVRYALSKGRPDVYMLSQLIPWGRGRSMYGGLASTMTELARALPPVKKLLDGAGARLLVSGVPFCVLGRWGRFSNDYNFTPRLVLERGGDAARKGALSAKKTLLPPLDRVKPAKCAACLLFDRCGGAFRGYLEKYGDGELRPVTAAAAARLAEAGARTL